MTDAEETVGTPTRDQIAEWLVRRGHPATWADYLEGLPWQYIRPVAAIAANSNVHPAAALATAALYSSDEEFRATARAHIDAKDPARPNRAQRRAMARAVRRRRPR